MEYWTKVKAYAQALNGDGCSDSPDLFYKRCCDEHDIAYRTGCDVDGNTITRSQADTRLFNCMREAGLTPIVGRFLVPAIYWGFVRAFGWKAWLKNK